MPSAYKAVADVAVIGLGAVGSAALHHLAKAGARPVGIDRFHPPHDRGSSHGVTRITRLAVGEGEAFVPLVARSHELWRELEQTSGLELFRRTGGLIIASPGAEDYAFHGPAGFFKRTVAIARAHGIAHERLSAAQIRARFAMFTPDDADEGYFEHDAGVLYAERIVQAQLDAAVHNGATLHLDERVLRLEPQGSDVVVHTEHGKVLAGRVLVTAGPWMPQLFGDAMGRRLRVLRQILFWFRASEPKLYAPGHCPIWIWVHGAGAAGACYGFPMGDGVDGVKVATEQDATETDPDRVKRNVSKAEVATMFETHLRSRLNGLVPEVVRTTTCLYTNTDDAGFVVRRHPSAASITLVSACSGHAFKHSAALGESLAGRVLGRDGGAPIDAFDPTHEPTTRASPRRSA